MTKEVVRRTMLVGTAVGAATCLSQVVAPKALATKNLPEDEATKPATDAELRKASSGWPVWNQTEESALQDVLNSGRWGRTSGARKLLEFEERFASLMQAKYCVATSSGTTSLMTALGALNIGPGDEVVLPPYTFVATFNAITNCFALPRFVDTDEETFQIDPRKIGAAIGANTKLVIPVHIGGSTADMDAIARVAAEHRVTILEDACQAPMAQWRGVPVGTRGIGGCFSFQASKNLTSGEGGAVITNDEIFAHQCYNYHTPGGSKPVPSPGRGANYRLTEFQASLLLAQLERFEEQARIREANARYLTEMLEKIPGILPAKLTDGCTRSAWHLYMLRYDKTHFAEMPRAKFLQELAKVKVSASAGYSSLTNSKHVQSLASNPHYSRIYGVEKMEQWSNANRCPVNDRLCEQAVWFSQVTLLGERSQMERIASEIAKIQKNAA